MTTPRAKQLKPGRKRRKDKKDGISNMILARPLQAGNGKQKKPDESRLPRNILVTRTRGFLLFSHTPRTLATNKAPTSLCVKEIDMLSMLILIRERAKWREPFGFVRLYHVNKFDLQAIRWRNLSTFGFQNYELQRIQDYRKIHGKKS
jgi:hypothetical protein